MPKAQKINNGYHFGTYDHQLVVDENKIVTRTMIVLKYQNIPVYFTNFDKYVSQKPIKFMESNSKLPMKYICRFLNFCYFEEHKIRCLRDIDDEMIISFLQKYAACTLSGDTAETVRSTGSVNRCVNTVLNFMNNLKKYQYTPNVDWHNIYRTQKKINTKTRRVENVEQIAFEVRVKQQFDRITFRDIPEEAFQIIMGIIRDKHQNIMMLAALGAFAGLRPSEACNVRRPEYGGIRFQMNGDIVTNVFINLKDEVKLRSDDVSVGGIKKHRVARVYPSFVKIFVEFYNEYIEYSEGKKFETEYGPLSTNRKGMAITYSSYAQEFKKVLLEAKEIMAKSDNPRIQLYAQMLNVHSFGPHIFRHWFTVKLVQNDENVSTIMFYRGDKNPNSATTYLQNKSELIKQLENVEDALFDYSMYMAEGTYDRH